MWIRIATIAAGLGVALLLVTSCGGRTQKGAVASDDADLLLNAYESRLKAVRTVATRMQAQPTSGSDAGQLRAALLDVTERLEYLVRVGARRLPESKTDAATGPLIAAAEQLDQVQNELGQGDADPEAIDASSVDPGSKVGALDKLSKALDRTLDVLTQVRSIRQKAEGVRTAFLDVIASSAGRVELEPAPPGLAEEAVAGEAVSEEAKAEQQSAEQIAEPAAAPPGEALKPQTQSYGTGTIIVEGSGDAVYHVSIPGGERVASYIPTGSIVEVPPGEYVVSIGGRRYLVNVESGRKASVFRVGRPLPVSR